MGAIGADPALSPPRRVQQEDFVGIHHDPPTRNENQGEPGSHVLLHHFFSWLLPDPKLTIILIRRVPVNRLLRSISGDDEVGLIRIKCLRGSLTDRMSRDAGG